MKNQTKVITDTSTVIESIANLMLAVAKAPMLIEAEVKKLRAMKIVIGTIKKDCAIALRFRAIFDSAKVSPATRDNYLSAVRSSVNNGTKFSFNPSQTKARAAVKATKAVHVATPGDDTEETEVDAPAGVAVKASPSAKLLTQPAMVIKAAELALNNVRAGCTQKAWAQVLVLCPELAKLMSHVDAWATTK